ncbi:Sulfide dehydrogenase subunit alpha [Desulfovibrionales bacterium]
MADYSSPSGQVLAAQINKKVKRSVLPRTTMPYQSVVKRISNFDEVALGYNFGMAMTEAKRCLQCKNPPCRKGCPVEVPIKEFIGYLAQGDVSAAFRAIRRTNSLPAVCGRVCPQENQCEGACVLKAKGQSVCIGRLERFVADEFTSRNACEELTGKFECQSIDPKLKVACIGSGPSSLTVAGYLSVRGFKVTVIEALHELGGVLVYGIPEFRLPKAIVKREIRALAENQVDLLTNWVGGKTITVSQLFDASYKAVFIGVGAGLPRFLNIPGENLIGVFSANEYLTRVNLGRAYAFPNFDTPIIRGKKVAVFGAGNVAMDAARTALRLGADHVYIIYRRTQQEMPARTEELEHALEEGVEFLCLCNPIAFHGDDKGFLMSVSLQQMELGEPDTSGRRAPVCIPNQTCELDIDQAIVAVGAGPNKVLLDATHNLKLNKCGYIEVNPATGETSIPDVFAGGDIVTGSATVIMAMGAGRRAAKEIARRFKPGSELD